MPTTTLVITFALIVTLQHSAWAATEPKSPASASPSCAAIIEKSAGAEKVLPSTQYVATVDSKTNTVNVLIPGLHTPLNLGKMVLLKAGTVFVHWGNQPEISTLQKIGLTRDFLAKSILSSPSSDVEGGGFYVSTSPTDSMAYGVDAVMFEINKDIKVVQSGWIQSSDRLDIVLALRNAGISAIQETAHPTWYNIIHEDVMSDWRQLDQKTALEMLKDLPPDQALFGTVLLDQKFQISAQNLPNGFLPIVGMLLSGQALAPADINLVKQASLVENGVPLMMLYFSGKLQQTPLFNAFNAACAKAFNGKSLTDEWGSH